MTMTAMQMITDAKAQVGSVAPQAAADELAAGTAVAVDVRESEEWQHGHIDASVPAPRGLLEFFADPTSPRHKDALDPDPPHHRRVCVRCPGDAGGAHAQEHGLRGRRRARGRAQSLDGRRSAHLRARVLRDLSACPN